MSTDQNREYPVQEIRLYAGEQADGRPVVETLAVIEPETGIFQLVRSPGFMRGIASGDRIRVDLDTGKFTLVQRSGNLCIRVIARDNIEAIAENLTPEMEKLGGALDYSNERMLIFSIHVSCGFQAIEALLNRHVGAGNDSAWIYGNVYQQENGEMVPMNWWQEILKPE